MCMRSEVPTSRSRGSLVLAAALWIVPGAGAAITATQVSAPSNPSFSIY